MPAARQQTVISGIVAAATSVQPATGSGSQPLAKLTPKQIEAGKIIQNAWRPQAEGEGKAKAKTPQALALERLRKLIPKVPESDTRLIFLDALFTEYPAIETLIAQLVSLAADAKHKVSTVWPDLVKELLHRLC